MKLSEDLEHCLLSVLISGDMDLTEITPNELSKPGQICHKTLDYLFKEGEKPPYKPKEILVAATELFGGNRSELYPYLKHVVGGKTGSATKTILETVRHKLAALRAIDTLSHQLAEGTFSLDDAVKQLQDIPPTSPLTSLSSLQGDRLIRALGGYRLGNNFTSLQEASGGFFGLWTIGGEPGSGKSTLALQLALTLSQENRIPVLYYDFENGPQVTLKRLGDTFGSVEEVRRQTHHVYLRDTIKTLHGDLKTLGKACLVVVDSFQSLPTRSAQRRQDLDNYLGRFEALKKDGHSILLISEINRSLYDKASLKGFKETGELEYKSDLAINLIGDAATPEVHIVKNRHGSKKGLVCQLLRSKAWWFAEMADGGSTGDL